MEESNKELSSLIERAWSLHGKLNIEIQSTSSANFCRFCSESGSQYYCDIANQTTPFVESESLIVIRDNVKDVGNILLFLQKLQTWQVKEQREAVNRLEASRLVLMELVKAYKRKNTPHVLGELRSCFGDDNPVTVRTLKARFKKHDRINQPNLNNKWSVFSLLRKLFMRWKWKKCIGTVVKFILFSLTISSMVKVSHTKKLYSKSRRKNFDSLEAGMRDSLLMISRNPLDVFQAKG